MSQDVWVTVSEIGIDSATQYESDQRVRRTGPSETIIYSGKVTAWGSFEQEITLPPGPPRISEASIEIADPFRIWRDLLSHQTARRRMCRINLLKAGTSLADSVTVYTGEIVKEVFPPAKVVLHLRDYLFSWLDEPFAVQVLPELYPDVDLAPEDVGGVIPIIIGSVRSVNYISPSIAQGVIPLPHIGLIGDGASPETFVDRWAIACHPIYDLVAVYRRETAQVNVDEGQPEWVLVSPSEYTTSETSFSAAENPFGFGAFTVTNLDFLAEQPKGTQIRIDCDGIERRGAWGPLAAVGASPPELLRNPIDAFINLTYTLMAKAGVSVDTWDTDDIGALREDFEVGFGSPPVVPLCDRAITEIFTPREILGQFCPSFNLFMFVNRMGKGTLKFISAEDPDRPIIKEGKHILKESFIEEKPEFVANQTQLRFLLNNATGAFESPTDTIIDNTTEQVVLELNGVSKIERETFDLPFVRDEATALLIQGYRNDFLSLGSFRQEFRVPAPPLLDVIEPARLVGLTHTMGLETETGYVNREALITNVLLDLDRMEYRVRTVLREPQTIEVGSQIDPLEESFRPVTYDVFDDDPPVNASRSRVTSPFSAFDNDTPIMGGSASYAQNQLASTTGSATYAKLWVYGWPVPNVLRTLESVTFHILVGAQVGSPDSFPFDSNPVIHAIIQNSKVPDEAGISYGASVERAFDLDLTTLSTDVPMDQYSIELTPSEYWDLVSRCEDANPYNILIRCNLWGTGLLNTIHAPGDTFGGAYELDWADTWVTFRYAPT